MNEDSQIVRKRSAPTSQLQLPKDPMTIRLLAIASLALFAIATPAHAAKTKKGAKGSSRALAHLDKDQNGTIDGKEATRAQAVYAALAALDADHNGQLSDSEIAAAKIAPAGKGKSGKKKKAQ